MPTTPTQSEQQAALSPATETLTAAVVTPKIKAWSFFGPAFVASVAYIDPGNFATNILGGAQFGYRLLWVLLWSNVMAILIQYLSAKLGIVTGKTLPRNCREQFSRPTTVFLWVCAEISAVATDLAEFLGAALGLDLLIGPALLAHGMTPTGSLFVSAIIATVAVFGILALDLAGFQWLERGIMLFVGVIGLCYGFEVFLVHPQWHQAFISTIVPSFDSHAMRESVYAAVGMLGATVMPHVVYLHSALVLPRVGSVSKERYLRLELTDIFVAMNGAWLINSAMIVMAAVAMFKGPSVNPTIQDAYHTLGPLLGKGAAVVFAVALLCSGLSSSTVGVMAGQVVLEGFLNVRLPIFMRRFVTIIPALVVIGMGWDPLRILLDSQVLLSFTLPAALLPLLVLSQRKSLMGKYVAGRAIMVGGWVISGIILALNGVLLVELIRG